MSERRPSLPPILVRILVVFVLGGIGVGCGIFDPEPDGGDPPTPFKYPSMSAPESTLLNLKYAWERKDSVRTRELYADDYVGTATNFDDPSGPPVTYIKPQEVAVVWALGRDPAVVSVVMDLKPMETWQRLHYSSDPPDVDTIDLLKGVKLEVVAGDNDYIANSSIIQYKFRREVAGSDTTWRIVRWSEEYQP